MYKQSPDFFVVDQIDTVEYAAIYPVESAGIYMARLECVVITRICHAYFFIFSVQNQRNSSFPGMIVQATPGVTGYETV